MLIRVYYFSGIFRRIGAFLFQSFPLEFRDAFCLSKVFLINTVALTVLNLSSTDPIFKNYPFPF
jgi:hypothetical protein